MKGNTYAESVQDRFGVGPEGQITDFLSRRSGHLLLADTIDLNALVERYGAPLEVAYTPQISDQIDRMLAWAETARRASGYGGAFLYAYATKANFAEEVVRTALRSGAHYETSATYDVVIAHQLWRQGILPSDRYMFCNGSKDAGYIAAIVALRHAGYERIIPVLDSPDELDRLLASCHEPLMLGVRERHAADVTDWSHPGNERFGLLPHEIDAVADRLRGTPHQLFVYHAMVGSQIEDEGPWRARLRASASAYARLRQRCPSLQILNVGGGIPTSAYTIGFSFDYAGFLERLMRETAAVCAEHGVPVPDLACECGRYTVATHSVFLMEVGSVKRGQGEQPDWHLLNGSMMVSLPDMLIVHGQEFVVLPLEGWDAPARQARLGGRATCDSDDFFPRAGQEPLLLPDMGEGQVIAFFGVGAYQQMISGRGGAHHCLTPEMRRIIIERDGDALVVREIAPQGLEQIMAALGYRPETLEQPAPRPTVPVERRAPRLKSRPQALFARRPLALMASDAAAGQQSGWSG